MRKQSGFTLIELMIVIAIIAIIAAIAIPNLLEARKSANESAAISSLRTLVTTQQLFRDSDRDGDGLADFAQNFTALAASANGSLIDSTLASGTKQGYSFAMSVPTGNLSWSCVATPVSNKTGTRRFFADESGVIRFSTGTASETSTPLGG
jgi:prepilin-type N-terminal cleavage/methylation domain-containing protein